jgi:outer membrane protein TolC
MIGEALGTYLAPLYAQHPSLTPPSPASSATDDSSGGNDGFQVGRWNTWSAGVSANMPLVNAQLWKSLYISDQDVELAVEKARSSRLETVTQVKQAWFGTLLAKQAFEVYKSVYENALENLDQIEKRYRSQRASELDLTRAKTTLANAIPNVYDAENAVMIALWQLKAVMGMNLDENIDVAGSLEDHAEHMFYDLNESAAADLGNNSTLRQLAIQAEQLAASVKLQQYASLPSLALGFTYSINAMANDFKFSEYQWSPYSFVGLSLSIPIFAGGKRSQAVKQAKVQAAELDLQRENTERQLKIAIRQYLNTMDTSMKSYASARSAVESAEKAYAIASKSYSVGRSTLTDLNDAQLALTQARLSVCQAIYNFVVAKANLEGALGADFIDENGEVRLNKTY